MEPSQNKGDIIKRTHFMTKMQLFLVTIMENCWKEEKPYEQSRSWAYVCVCAEKRALKL